jgi:hypothetical protein
MVRKRHALLTLCPKAGQFMLITLRWPRSSALKLHLSPGETNQDQQEVVTTLTAVELAGRLSIATGTAISPEAVVQYFIAWQSARQTFQQLVEQHGRPGLLDVLREICHRRALWMPHDDKAALEWFSYLLEAHFLGQVAAERPGLEGGLLALDLPIAQKLGDLCEESFALAFHLWAQKEV